MSYWEPRTTFHFPCNIRTLWKLEWLINELVDLFVGHKNPGPVMTSGDEERQGERGEVGERVKTKTLTQNDKSQP